MKTRLRCAFNKAPDIIEEKKLHRMKCANPYKVYSFIHKAGQYEMKIMSFEVAILLFKYLSLYHVYVYA